jgi:hypothetical protein
VMNSRRLMVFPKAKDHGPIIAGPGAGSGRASQQKRPLMSALGQKRKGSTRAHDVRFAPESGHRPTRRACPLSAKSRLMHRSQDCRIHGLGSLSFFSLPDCG